MKIKLECLIAATFYPLVWLCIFASRVGDKFPARGEVVFSWSDVGCFMFVVVPTLVFAFMAGTIHKNKE